MSSVVQKLTSKGLISPPNFVSKGIQYEVMMGSVAYGVSNDTSDIDIYGFCIPPKDVIFPHLRGVIPGFDKQIQQFGQYQQHHVKIEGSDKEYDLSIYNIVKYFRLCMDNNPNMIDSLFIPQRCVLFCTPIGQMVRDNRKLFLHKGSFYKYKGYAFSQVHKMQTKNPEGKRKELVDKYGYDVKFGYHVKRLLLQVEQIMLEGDLDLERNREELKAIRRGEVTLDSLLSWFDQKEKQLEDLYSKSSLPHGPNTPIIKQLLLNCLEEYYGSLTEAEYRNPNKYDNLVNDLKGLMNKYNI
jgi:uncharacterized protein